MASILKGAPVVAAMNERNAALCEQLKAKSIVPTRTTASVGTMPFSCIAAQRAAFASFMAATTGAPFKIVAIRITPSMNV